MASISRLATRARPFTAAVMSGFCPSRSAAAGSAPRERRASQQEGLSWYTQATWREVRPSLAWALTKAAREFRAAEPVARNKERVKKEADWKMLGN